MTARSTSTSSPVGAPAPSILAGRRTCRRPREREGGNIRRGLGGTSGGPSCMVPYYKACLPHCHTRCTSDGVRRLGDAADAGACRLGGASPRACATAAMLSSAKSLVGGSADLRRLDQWPSPSTFSSFSFSLLSRSLRICSVNMWWCGGPACAGRRGAAAPSAAPDTDQKRYVWTCKDQTH